MSHESGVGVGGSRVLVVGAGGIGCELLKNLVLAGFKFIVVVDLDTIDVTNLNRQFLFRKKHVGMSKAKVATDIVKKIRPDVDISYFHDSITSLQFNHSFFSQFDIVLSALDNRKARNHVNRHCLASEKPLIESGSAGYIGQVGVILKGKTECYECVPKSDGRTYPTCTVRNTPSEPIHCIIWAKHLFNQLFGEADEDEEVSPDFDDPELGNGKGVEKQTISTKTWADQYHYDPKKLFEKLFVGDIRYLLSMENLWKHRTKPVPLFWNDLADENPCGSKSSSNVCSLSIPDQRVWTPLECRHAFESTTNLLRKMIEGGSKSLIWDKDDDIGLDFVVSAANLRSHIFGIPLKSRFDIKSMAGNIIPAIATTNAMVAGMMVMEAMKIVENRFDDCRSVFISRAPNPSGKILVDQIPDKPNGKCFVCSDMRKVFVHLDTAKFTVHLLEKKVLKEFLTMTAPDVTVADGNGKIIISSDEDDNLQDISCTTLAENGIVDGTKLHCDDFEQEIEFILTVIHDTIHFERGDPHTDFWVEEPGTKAESSNEGVNGDATTNGVTEKLKQDKRSLPDSDGPEPKKARLAHQNDF